MSRLVTLPLHRIAHGRAGDKGNRLSVSVIAYHPDAWPVLLHEVTEARVLALFAHRGASRVTRYFFHDCRRSTSSSRTRSKAASIPVSAWTRMARPMRFACSA